MKNKLTYGIFLAILAAALYAVNSPFSKLLLDYMPSTLMAGFLYVGAGLGMGVDGAALVDRGYERFEDQLCHLGADFLLTALGEGRKGVLQHLGQTLR